MKFKSFTIKNNVILLSLLIALILSFGLLYYSENSDKYSLNWFEKTAHTYDADTKKPLHYFSNWIYWSEEDWEKYVKHSLDFLDPQLKNGDKVFESGVGVGGYLKILKNIYPELKLYGVDISPESIKIANQVLDGKFYVGNSIDLSKEKDNQYDYVLSNGVIGYLDNLDEAYKFVSEMVRITKKGRQIFIGIIPNKSCIFTSFNLCVPLDWWEANKDKWGVDITRLDDNLVEWPGAHHQYSRYVVFLRKK